MRLIARFEDGKEIELKEIEGLSADSKAIVVFLSSMWKQQDIDLYEQKLSDKFGMKVIVLDARYKSIMSLT